MARCASCNTRIVFGGVKDGGTRYCNDDCHRVGYFMSLANQLSSDAIERFALDLKRGACPKCGKSGTSVDVYKAYRIWSLAILSSWSSNPELSCRTCATKRQIGSIFYSGVLGWWSIPWGVLGTPVQVVRNLGALLSGSKSGKPTKLLLNHVKLVTGQKMAQDLHQARQDGGQI